MRTTYALVGLAWLILIVGGVYAFNHRFTRLSDTGVQVTSSSTSMTSSTLMLTSSAFENNTSIPAKFTCDEQRAVNPPLSITGVPENTKSLVLIMDDPDVPKALHSDGVFDHWILFNIPPETKEIASGSAVGMPGANNAGSNQYTGPCPPKQYEPSEHHYFFKLYALDTSLPLEAGASKAQVERAMEGHIISQTELVGKYKRK